MFNLETKVGAMIVGGALALVGGVLLVNDFDIFKSEYELKAEFPSADGIRVGSSIKEAGVAVGKIKDIELNRGKVRVIMAINDKFEIPKGSQFTIIASGVLGDKYIEITPNLNEDKMLTDGEIIQGVNSKDITAAVDQAITTMEDVSKLTNSFNDIVGDEEFKKAITESVINLNESMASMSVVMADMQGLSERQQANIEKIIVNMAAMSNNMAAASGDIRVLVRDIEDNGGSAQKMKNILANLDEASARAAQITKDVQGLTGDEQFTNDLKGTVHNANKLLSSAGKSKFRFQIEGQGGSNSHKLRTTANVLFYPNDDQFFLMGLTNTNDKNKANIQYGKSLSSHSLVKAGLFESCAGIAYNQRIGKVLSIEGQATTDHDAHFKAKARAYVKPDLALTYQYNNLFRPGEHEFNLGLEKTF